MWSWLLRYCCSLMRVPKSFPPVDGGSWFRPCTFFKLFSVESNFLLRGLILWWRTSVCVLPKVCIAFGLRTEFCYVTVAYFHLGNPWFYDYCSRWWSTYHRTPRSQRVTLASKISFRSFGHLPSQFHFQWSFSSGYRVGEFRVKYEAEYHFVLLRVIAPARIQVGFDHVFFNKNVTAFARHPSIIVKIVLRPGPYQRLNSDLEYFQKKDFLILELYLYF